MENKCIECNRNKRKYNSNLCGLCIHRVWLKINKERKLEWEKQKYDW